MSHKSIPLAIKPLILLLLFPGFSCFAEIIENIEYNYYVISPRSPDEIKPELIRNTPIRSGAGSFNGHTDWYIDWSYRSTSGPYGCQLTDTNIKVHVVHILPALSKYVTDKQTIETFNKFNSALTLHEKNHGKHGLLAAREIEDAIKQIPNQQNCRTMSRMVDDTGKNIVAKYIQKDNEYDRATNSGATEGAVIY